MLRRVHAEGTRERRMRATEAGSTRHYSVMARSASAAGPPDFHPQGRLLTELCTVVIASLKLWAVSGEVVRVATSCNTAPETL